MPGQPVASYFAVAESDVDDGYTAVNWGTERHFIDARSGAKVEKPRATPRKQTPAPVNTNLPQPGARLLSYPATGAAALYLANGPTGSHLWLAGGAGRPLTSFVEMWKANEWLREVKLGRAKPFTYKASDGSTQTAWLLCHPITLRERECR